jgi:hypothetical protein
MADDSFFSNASDWSFKGPGVPFKETSSVSAPAICSDDSLPCAAAAAAAVAAAVAAAAAFTGKMPSMETSSFNAPAAFIQDGEVGPLPRADTATLGAYLGNSDLVSLEEPGAAAQGAQCFYVCVLSRLVRSATYGATQTPCRFWHHLWLAVCLFLFVHCAAVGVRCELPDYQQRMLPSNLQSITHLVLEWRLCAGVGVRRQSSDHDFLANLDQLVALSSQRPASATSEHIITL